MEHHVTDVSVSPQAFNDHWEFNHSSPRKDVAYLDADIWNKSDKSPYKKKKNYLCTSTVMQYRVDKFKCRSLDCRNLELGDINFTGIQGSVVSNCD